MAPTPASWLFVKGTESIWVVRPHGYSMIVSGPGKEGLRRDFTQEDEVQAFQIDMAERLTNKGWMLWGVGRQRRTGVDRRGSARGAGNDRRRSTDQLEAPAPRRASTLSDA